MLDDPDLVVRTILETTRLAEAQDAASSNGSAVHVEAADDLVP
jgi:hypothetical protein